MTDYHCTVSADDGQGGTGAHTSGTLNEAEYNRFIDPAASSFAYAHIDTSAIGTDVISAATLHYYCNNNTKFPKTLAHNNYIQISTTTIFSTASKVPSGWNSHALTSGGLSLINKSGDTFIYWRVGGGLLIGETRNWWIRAWDYTPTGDFSAYLAITHAPAGGPTKMTIVGV